MKRTTSSRAWSMCIDDRIGSRETKLFVSGPASVRNTNDAVKGYRPAETGGAKLTLEGTTVMRAMAGAAPQEVST